MGSFVKHLRHAPSIVVQGLTGGFGERRAVSAVGVTASHGEVFGYVVLNGADKATL